MKTLMNLATCCVSLFMC